jgi:hypothetical protein
MSEGWTVWWMVALVIVRWLVDGALDGVVGGRLTLSSFSSLLSLQGRMV